MTIKELIEQIEASGSQVDEIRVFSFEVLNTVFSGNKSEILDSRYANCTEVSSEYDDGILEVNINED